MDKQDITKATTEALGRFGNAAHQAIDLYRNGGERIATIAGERWDTAFAQAKPQLDAETRKNATHAKDVFARYYSRAVALTADGAQIVVDTFVGATIAGVERVAAYKHA
ncbi:MAG TPA: hypothetical protein VMZ74_08100 [Ramlibacter sp.]|nr:hypothetical protein [Ramlibacter sp.]